MSSLISSGTRIATERTDGWTRQLRITPLATSAYFGAKVITGYTMAAVTIALLYASGVSLGVNLSAERWFEMTGLIVVALIPFAVLGIFLGHLLTADSIGPAIGGIVSLLALVSGTWFPIGSHGILHDIAQYLPSYWLVASQSRRPRRFGVERDWVDRDRRLDDYAWHRRPDRLPPGHRSRLTG